jgi:hypothetical protein
MGHMPSRVRAKAPGADAAVAVALRELGAHGKDEQRTAAR